MAGRRPSRLPVRLIAAARPDGIPVIKCLLPRRGARWFVYITRADFSHRMHFRHQFLAIDAAQLEELRRQDARRAMERECRLLRRLFASLEKEHRSLRAEHDFQSQRLDSMVVQSGALLTLIRGLTFSTTAGSVAASYGDVVTIPSEELAAIQSEKKSLTEERALLMRKNVDLELQLNAMVTQFGSLLTDYEGVRGKLADLKSAVASAASIEELGDRWVEI